MIPISTGIPLSCCKLNLLQLTIPGMEHAPLKEGELLRVRSSISHSQSIFACLTILPPLTNMYGMHNQVPKAANFPFLKARWAHSVFHWYNHLASVFVPFVGFYTVHKNIIAHTEAHNRFTQQALNDSQQRLSLPNTG